MMTSRKRIILVDDQITNLTIGRNALFKTYDVFTVPSGEKLLQILSMIFPDMILLDVEMPGMNGYDVIRILKANPQTASIPVIFLTANNNPENEIKGLSLGAIDYILKPFSPPLLLKRIEVHLLVEQQKRELEIYSDNLIYIVKEKTKSFLQLQNAVMEMLSDVVEDQDDMIDRHIKQMQAYLKILIDGIPQCSVYKKESLLWNSELLLLSTDLHDFGNTVPNENLARKSQRLTLKRSTKRLLLNYAKTLSISHHEKWDGTGYPYGLKGREIPLPGRLMAIIDVYDALTSERLYKKPLSHEEAVKIIEKEKGSRFDPGLVDLFLSVSDKLKEMA